MKATLAQVKAAAAKFGGTVEDDSAGRWKVFQICAPFGHLWNDGDSKHLVCQAAAGEAIWPAFNDALARIACGVRLADAEEQQVIEEFLPTETETNTQ